MPADPLAAPLAALTARVRDDLARIAHPSPAWLVPHPAPDGTEALDVLVVGAGQSGLAVGVGLLRAHVDNILLVDAAPRGMEGPWLSYARMATLRSPKDYTGPELDLPSLGYQAWHEAVYGAASWQALELIRRQDWAAYLLWVRDAVGVPVRNEAAVTAIAPAGRLLAASFADGTRRYARKIVLATGQDGMGSWWLPPFLAALPPGRRAHSADPIDFAALRGRRVAVLGVGASALDNAACALEAGAAEVAVYCRRPAPQLVQPYRWLTFAGFLRHLGDLPDAWRWRFMHRILTMREGFTQAGWDRCARHAAFRLVTGTGWNGAAMAGQDIRIDTTSGPVTVDFVIAATGVEMDFTRRPELAACAGAITRWADRYTPPPGEENPRLASFPYLGPDYALIPRLPGFDWIGNLHVFGIAATASFGPSGSSINAMSTAAPKLVQGLTRGLFTGDVERHWADFLAYDVPQAQIGQPPG